LENKNGPWTTKDSIAAKSCPTSCRRKEERRYKSKGSRHEGSRPFMCHLQVANARPEDIQTAFREQTFEVTDARRTRRCSGLKMIDSH